MQRQEDKSPNNSQFPFVLVSELKSSLDSYRAKKSQPWPYSVLMKKLILFYDYLYLNNNNDQLSLENLFILLLILNSEKIKPGSKTETALKPIIAKLGKSLPVIQVYISNKTWPVCRKESPDITGEDLKRAIDLYEKHRGFFQKNTSVINELKQFYKNLHDENAKIPASKLRELNSILYYRHSLDFKEEISGSITDIVFRPLKTKLGDNLIEAFYQELNIICSYPEFAKNVVEALGILNEQYHFRANLNGGFPGNAPLPIRQLILDNPSEAINIANALKKIGFIISEKSKIALTKKYPHEIGNIALQILFIHQKFQFQNSKQERQLLERLNKMYEEAKDPKAHIQSLAEKLSKIQLYTKERIESPSKSSSFILLRRNELGFATASRVIAETIEQSENITAKKTKKNLVVGLNMFNNKNNKIAPIKDNKAQSSNITSEKQRSCCMIPW